MAQNICFSTKNGSLFKEIALKERFLHSFIDFCFFFLDFFSTFAEVKDIVEEKYNIYTIKVKKLFIETYGCQMNVADSEVVASVMRMAGYEVCDDMKINLRRTVCWLFASHRPMILIMEKSYLPLYIYPTLLILAHVMK